MISAGWHMGTPMSCKAAFRTAKYHVRDSPFFIFSCKNSILHFSENINSFYENFTKMFPRAAAGANYVKTNKAVSISARLCLFVIILGLGLFCLDSEL